MKTKSLPRFLTIASVAVSLSVLSLTSGCLAVAAAAGAGAVVAYVRGELQTTLVKDLETTDRATNAAVQQLGFAKVSEKKDALNAVVIARTATDKKIEITLESTARDLTKIRIRVGLVGDQSLSMAILDKIRSNL
jgi:hypothetical protein